MQYAYGFDDNAECIVDRGESLMVWYTTLFQSTKVHHITLITIRKLPCNDKILFNPRGRRYIMDIEYSFGTNPEGVGSFM